MFYAQDVVDYGTIFMGKIIICKDSTENGEDDEFINFDSLGLICIMAFFELHLVLELCKGFMNF